MEQYEDRQQKINLGERDKITRTKCTKHKEIILRERKKKKKKTHGRMLGISKRLPLNSSETLPFSTLIFEISTLFISLFIFYFFPLNSNH